MRVVRRGKSLQLSVDNVTVEGKWSGAREVGDRCLGQHSIKPPPLPFLPQGGHTVRAWTPGAISTPCRQHVPGSLSSEES